jgi:hypothetical protein
MQTLRTLEPRRATTCRGELSSGPIYSQALVNRDGRVRFGTEIFLATFAWLVPFVICREILIIPIVKTKTK